jgi:hypothetical protein
VSPIWTLAVAAKPVAALTKVVAMLHMLRTAAAGLAAAITATILSAVPAFAMVPPPEAAADNQVLVVPAEPITNVVTNPGPGLALVAGLVVIALLAGAAIGYFSRRWTQDTRPVATA